jgi:hypothetical protein
VTPPALETDLPTLLELPPPRLRVYPRETVVAEKLEALVQLGMANTRMKDFYDLAVLAARFPFDGATLVRATRSTFDNRGTAVPATTPIALTSAFYDDATKRQQWRAFLRKSHADDLGELSTVIAAVRTFLEPVLAAAAQGAELAHWPAGGPWTS